MTTPAPDAYLSVICQPSDTATFEAFRARAQAAGMTEYRTVPMVYHEWCNPAPVEIVEWWTQLAAGATTPAPLTARECVQSIDAPGGVEVCVAWMVWGDPPVPPTSAPWPQAYP